MTIHIVGLGLMGAAFARVLTEAGHRITGEDINPDHLQFARTKGWIQASKLEIATTHCIIIALPVEATLSWIHAHQQVLKSIPLVVDMTGVKKETCSEKNPLVSSGHYLSLHPMAGHPSAGPFASESVKVTGTPMLGINTNLNPQAEGVLTNLITSLGCAPIQWMSVDQHDTWIAYSSHLPHILAGVLASIPLPETTAEAGTSLAMMNRLASMQPALWSDLFIRNKQWLMPMIEASIQQLKTFHDGLSKEDLTAWFGGLVQRGTDR